MNFRFIMSMSTPARRNSSAEADTLATYEVLKSQLDRYPEELQNDMAFLAEYSSFIIPDSRSLIFVSTFFVFSVKSPFSIQL